MPCIDPPVAARGVKSTLFRDLPDSTSEEGRQDDGEGSGVSEAEFDLL